LEEKEWRGVPTERALFKRAETIYNQRGGGINRGEEKERVARNEEGNHRPAGGISKSFRHIMKGGSRKEEGGGPPQRNMRIMNTGQIHIRRTSLPEGKRGEVKIGEKDGSRL